MRNLVPVALLCLVALVGWVLLQKKVHEPAAPAPTALDTGGFPGEPGKPGEATGDEAGRQPRRPTRPARSQEQGMGTATTSQSPDNANVKTLLEDARSQDRLAEFGAGLAMDGSRKAVATLLKAIDLVEGEERSQLARSLQALHSSEASAELQTFMVENSTDAVVAVQVRDALARIATGDDVLRMGQSLPSDPEQGLARSYLLGTLARVRNPDAVPELTELCLSSDPAIYTSAAIALGGIGSAEAVSALVNLIEKLAVADVNDPIVQALLSVANKDAKVALQDVYRSTTNPVIEYAAAEALFAIEQQSSDAQNSR